MKLTKHRELTAIKIQRCERLHEMLNSEEPIYPRDMNILDMEYRKLCYEIDTFIDRVLESAQNN